MVRRCCGLEEPTLPSAVQRHLDWRASVWYPSSTLAASSAASEVAMLATASAMVLLSVTAVLMTTIDRRRVVLSTLLAATSASAPAPPVPPTLPTPRLRLTLGGPHVTWAAGTTFGSSSPEADEEAELDEDNVEPHHRDRDESATSSTLPKCSQQLGKGTSSFAGSECKVPPTGRPPDVIRRPP